MIIEIKERRRYYNATEFLEKTCGYDELKDNFEVHLEEYFKDENKWIGKFQELCEAIAETLNSFAWSDEEIISQVLQNRTEKYMMSYVEPNHLQEDYFEILEI